MITRKFAEFVTETPTSEVPDAALDAACNGLIDTLGCALAGTLEPASEIAGRWALENSARGSATVWGRGTKASGAEAAFANAVSAHALDFDDSHPSVRGHASASLVPTAIAAGETANASGHEVLAAYAIGLEIAAKVGLAFGSGHLTGGWHPTASAGTLASTAVAARLSGHDAETLQRAWGVAGSEISGLLRNFGTMTKPYHAGHAARSGIVASWMAGAGFTADTDIFVGTGGVFDAYHANGAALETLVTDLGKAWEIIEPSNYVKRWPCCYSNHRSIGALYQMIEDHQITADAVDEVTVSFLPDGDKALVSRQPKTGLEGKFSIEYVVAAMLLDGPLTLATFTDEMVMRPEAQALIAKVKRQTIPDENKYTGLVGYNVVSVATPNGRFELREDRTPGSPAWPLTDAERAAKFIDCAKLALGDKHAHQLLDTIGNCRNLPDIGELARATVVQSNRAAELKQAAS